jgi:hypothetical protein
MELGRVFVDIFTGTSLPVGSVVLLSSASHLASVGTAGYAEDVARCSKYLLQAFSNNIHVKHGVFTLLNGTESPELIRSIAEIDGWLSHLHGMDSFPINARKACNLAIKNAGSGTQTDYCLKLRFPTSLNTYEKTTLISSGWGDLPCTVAQLSPPQEKDIIDALLSDLNGVFSFTFGTDVSVIRDVRAGARRTGRKIVVVGASLAERLHEAVSELGEN